MSGHIVCMVEVAGKFGRDLAAQGEPGMIAFALEWLGELYGADEESRQAHRADAMERWTVDAGRDVGRRTGRSTAAQGADGAWVQRVVCWRSRARNLWGTVDGAWESGERAATCSARGMGSHRARSSGAAEPAHQSGREPCGDIRGRSAMIAASAVRFSTSATIFSADASISSSVMVLFARLQGHGDRDRLLVGLDTFAFVDVEYRNASDQFLSTFWAQRRCRRLSPARSR